MRRLKEARPIGSFRLSGDTGVYVSAFELYRVGPGPSSSYTVGPQRAALRFVADLTTDGILPMTTRIEAELYGGLAFNGRAHASDKAVVAGLSGLRPDRCDAAALASCVARAETERWLLVGGRRRIRFDPAQDVRLVVNRSLAFDGNAMRFLARNPRGEILASRVYFSTGSGAVVAEEDVGDAPRMPRIPYPYATADELLAACQVHAKRIPDLVRANECAMHSPGEVRAGLLDVAQAMRSAIERGLTTEGVLPGGARRTAPSWADALRATDATPGELCAVYATAIAEENAAGGRVVAAPSSGAAGPVAALLQHWRDSGPLRQDDGAIDFLLAGAAVGGLLRCAGVAQVGCQGEVGVAAAMAAAGYATALGGSNAQVLHAAERALEPHLGLACDPASGRIEDPCIERNALAATRAYDAAVAAVRMPVSRVGLDVLARSLVESGRAMTTRPKSSSIGGLAVNVVEC